MARLDNSVTGSFVEDRDTNVSIGLDLPLHKDVGVQGYFASTKTTVEAVKNNIRNLLLTNRGERVFQPLLGLNLRQFLFEQITPDTVFAIQNDIRDTINLWLPFVLIENIQVDEDKANTNALVVKVDFRIQKVPNALDSVTVRVE
jgi:phage baseplate assembly protein W